MRSDVTSDPTQTSLEGRRVGVTEATGEAPSRWCPTSQFVHAGDVGQAVVGALDNPSSIGRSYNVTGPAQSLASLSRTFRRARGIRGSTIAIPLPVRVEWSNEAAETDLRLRFRSVEEGLAESFSGS